MRTDLLSLMGKDFNTELNNALSTLTLKESSIIIEKYISFIKEVKVNNEVNTDDFIEFIYTSFPKQSQYLLFIFKFTDNTLTTYVDYLSRKEELNDLESNIFNKYVKAESGYNPLNDTEYYSLLRGLYIDLCIKRKEIVDKPIYNDNQLGLETNESSLNFNLTDRERIEKLLMQLKNKNKQGTAIVDDAFFNILVNAYEKWISNREYPKVANRHRFYGENYEFYSVLNHLHKMFPLKISGIGVVLSYHIAINNNLSNKIEACSANTIEKNIKIYQYKTNIVPN